MMRGAREELIRCPWAKSEPSVTYHDAEWGVKQTDDRALFELLVLEGAQAGLSWETILRKRTAYRAAFADFDPAVVAGFDSARIEALEVNAGIVRHRGKIASAVANACAFLAVQSEFGSFSNYLWGFVDGVPVVTRRAAGESLPARTALSDAVSADLRRRGFSFAAARSSTRICRRRAWLMTISPHASGPIAEAAARCLHRLALARIGNVGSHE